MAFSDIADLDFSLDDLEVDRIWEDVRDLPIVEEEDSFDGLEDSEERSLDKDDLDRELDEDDGRSLVDTDLNCE